MTKEQAFREWCQDDWDKERMGDCWNAACDWQKEQDIKFCEEWGCIVNYKDISDD